MCLNKSIRLVTTESTRYGNKNMNLKLFYYTQCQNENEYFSRRGNCKPQRGRLQKYFESRTCFHIGASDSLFWLTFTPEVSKRFCPRATSVVTQKSEGRTSFTMWLFRYKVNELCYFLIIGKMPSRAGFGPQAVVWRPLFYSNADHTRRIRKGRDVTKSDACAQKSHRTHAVCIQL